MAIVIVDLDDTVCDTRHRDRWRKAIPPQWDKFHATLCDDPPIENIVFLIDCLADWGHTIVFMTARPETYRDETTKWITRHFIKFHMFELYMRPEWDTYRTSVELKSALYKEHFINKDREAWIVIEDKPHVCRMWRERWKLTCLQVEI